MMERILNFIGEAVGAIGTFSIFLWMALAIMGLDELAAPLLFVALGCCAAVVATAALSGFGDADEDGLEDDDADEWTEWPDEEQCSANTPSGLMEEDYA